MIPSDEQDAILEYRLDKPDTSFQVRAGAGCAKTTTLLLLACRDKRKTVYLSYNRSARQSAARMFPKHVDCATTHMLAYRCMKMWEQQNRLDGSKVTGLDIAELFSIPVMDQFKPSLWGQWTIDTVNAFCHSAELDIGPQHLTLPPRSERGNDVLGWAKRLWQKIADPKDPLPIGHDHYLKQWQLSHPQLPADIQLIDLDEAQDTNPVTMAILQALALPTIYVGDPHQSLYGYRGAVNVLETLDLPAMPLRVSYRFGQTVADIANTILAYHSRPPELPLRGNLGIESRIVDALPEGERHMIVCRTNAGILEEAIGSSGKIHVVGGARENALEKLVQLLTASWDLYQGTPAPHIRELCGFRDYKTLVEHAIESRDIELTLLVKLVDQYSQKIPDIARDLLQRSVRTEDQANTVLGTAHRLKGREADYVKLANDFPDWNKLFATDKNGKPLRRRRDIDAELNALYVAGTRAKLSLVKNDAIASLEQPPSFQSLIASNDTRPVAVSA